MRKYVGLYVALALGAIILSVLMQNGGGWDQSPVKAAIVPLAGFFLNLFNSPATAIAFSGAIVLVGLAMSAGFWFGQVKPVLRELKDLTGLAASTQSIADRGQRLARLADGFDRSALMRREFRLFACAVGRAEHTAPRSSDYLDMAAVERAGCGVSSFGQLGAHVVGVGLVLTFCGLVAGLYFASKGLVASDLATARASLVQLLQASTFKFLTSIAGISTSIFIGLVHQRASGALSMALDDVTLSVDEALA